MELKKLLRVHIDDANVIVVTVQAGAHLCGKVLECMDLLTNFRKLDSVALDASFQ